MTVAKLKKRFYFVAAKYFRHFADKALKRWKPRVIAITGSAGKTTMLNLMEHEMGKKAHYSHDANSAFGVSFDILGLKGVDSFDVINIHLSCRNVASGFVWLPSWKRNDFKNSKGEPIKYLEEWQAIAAASEQKRIEIHLGQFNGYRNWLKTECDNRGRKHGFIL